MDSPSSVALWVVSFSHYGELPAIRDWIYLDHACLRIPNPRSAAHHLHVDFVKCHTPGHFCSVRLHGDILNPLWHVGPDGIYRVPGLQYNIAVTGHLQSLLRSR